MSGHVMHHTSVVCGTPNVVDTFKTDDWTKVTCRKCSHRRTIPSNLK